MREPNNNVRIAHIVMNKQKVHIGKLIKEKFEENGMSRKDFADRIPCSYPNLYNILDSDDIYYKRLIKISKILDFDFIKHLSELDEQKSESKYVINTTYKYVDKIAF